MVIAVTGSHTSEPTSAEMREFWLLWNRLGGDHLVHGAAAGVDSTVGEHVAGDGWAVTPVAVDHALDGPWPAAGPRRNRRMLDTHRPAVLIAFHGNRGTQDCIRAATARKIPVHDLSAQQLGLPEISRDLQRS